MALRSRVKTPEDDALREWARTHPPPYSPEDEAERLALLADALGSQAGPIASEYEVKAHLVRMPLFLVKFYAFACEYPAAEQQEVRLQFVVDRARRVADELAAVANHPRLQAYLPQLRRSQRVVNYLVDEAQAAMKTLQPHRLPNLEEAQASARSSRLGRRALKLAEDKHSDVSRTEWLRQQTQDMRLVLEVTPGLGIRDELVEWITECENLASRIK